jgi:uncharacterized protein HemX
MPETRRRHDDVRPEDSVISKITKSKTGDLLIRAVITVIIGGGAGFAVHEKKDIETQNLATELQEQKTALAEFRRTYYQREREERKEHDALMQAARERLVAIETELRLIREGHH